MLFSCFLFFLSLPLEQGDGEWTVIIMKIKSWHSWDIHETFVTFQWYSSTQPNHHIVSDPFVLTDLIFIFYYIPTINTADFTSLFYCRICPTNKICSRITWYVCKSVCIHFAQCGNVNLLWMNQFNSGLFCI